MNLNDVMELGTVVLVDADGGATPECGVLYAPELVADTDADGQCTPESDQGLIQQAEDAGWELLTGWSGQWGYHGPEMHPSEFIGGALAEHILATPGYWAAVAVSYPDDAADGGWCIAWREDPRATTYAAKVSVPGEADRVESGFETAAEAWQWLADEREEDMERRPTGGEYLEDVWHYLVAQASEPSGDGTGEASTEEPPESQLTYSVVVAPASREHDRS